MNPFGVESHDISKALPGSTYKSKEAQKHEKHAVGNIIGGGVAMTGGAVAAQRHTDKTGDASSSAYRAQTYRNHATAIKDTVESAAKRGTIHPSTAVDRGREWGRATARAAEYNKDAISSLKSAGRAKKAAVAGIGGGAVAYGNGIRHAIKADNAEAKHKKQQRAKIKKSAFGIDH